MILRDRTANPVAWIVTLVAAAGLLVLGWWLGRDNLAPLLEQARSEAVKQADRAGRLLAENRSLEKRLKQLRERMDSRGDVPARDETAPGDRTSSTRMLSRGQAVVDLDGKVTITLDDISLKPRRAAIKVKVLGGREGRAYLAVGSELRFRVSGQTYSLVVKRIFTTSVSYSLISQP